MADAEKKFTVWVRLRESDSKLTQQLGQWLEPIEAVEAAESLLSASGRPNESFAEVRFNGDREPHIVVGYLGDGRVSLYNSDSCRWPVFNIEGTQSFRDMLLELPDWMKGNQDDYKRPEDKEEDYGRTEEDTSPTEPISGGEEEDEDRPQDAGSLEHEDAEDDEEEQPMRFKLFSKLRSPKGWRKRAEADMEREVNTFQFRAGFLDETDPNRPLERPFLFAALKEQNENRETAEFKVVLPPGVEFERVTDRTWRAHIPFDVLDR